MDRTSAREQMPCRLIKFEENYKFRDYKSSKEPSKKGMGAFVRDLKEEFKSVENVYVWHALCGYWGSVRPKIPGLPESRLITPKLSKGLEMTMEDLAVDKIVESRIGLVPPERVHEMYEGLHSHLESAAIDGVKVDVIHDFGGRVELAKAYYKALTASVRKHFKGNGVIASMEHYNDFMYLGTETISLGRVGNAFDFLRIPFIEVSEMERFGYKGVTWCIVHTIACGWATSYTQIGTCSSLLIPVPDSTLLPGSGGPIYVSDSVGKHNFELLRSPVLPDGTILRCQHYALPTRDYLFQDPLHDGKTMLKIWNLNKYTGVLGVFNCQGGGWCSVTRKNVGFAKFSNTISCLASPNDIEWNNGKDPMSCVNGVNVFAVYMFQENKLKLLKISDKLEISLEPFNYELLTVSPVKVLPKRSIQFALIGLVTMLNSGGAIQSLVFDGLWRNEGVCFRETIDVQN
ncbi:hypothetical protein Pint_15509 [Pistacia integerrima]|uniref:Uncharacterized protein n=1 Tax=Pistacia integerrima TaxID=434235 RepID=A0ACC0ZDN7_9ROSI|nr:hypothetical protein Pint_15509 [Pistacia integerrima]